ncbi:GNAT family N-acetyltransferase, partial [Vibrio lentus]
LVLLCRVAASFNYRLKIIIPKYSNAARGTLINKECKYLLLKQLFERYEAIAVEFRTHTGNTVSRKAIEGLGANLDGILRHHQILKDGSVRDTVVYSIIDSEWPEVKQGFLKKLSQQEP